MDGLWSLWRRDPYRWFLQEFATGYRGPLVFGGGLDDSHNTTGSTEDLRVKEEIFFGRRFLLLD